MTADDTSAQQAPDAVSVTGSGAASADRGGVANPGVIIGDVTTNYHDHRPRPAPVWPVLVGQPPALASAFQPRASLRDSVVAARRHGDDVVLAHRDSRGGHPGTQVLTGGGGVGKSQLAAWFARQTIDARGTDLVVWVDAASPDQIITGYARAAVRAGVPGADGTDPDADAAALLEWLHTTERSWLVVLDDVGDPGEVARWWPPQRPSGWTLATTRLHDSALTSSGRQQINVDVYTPAESVAYLSQRLTEARCAHLLDDQVASLTAAVGHLPLALSHAAAYMINQEQGCAAYLADYRSGAQRLADLMPASADPDAYGRPVAVTLLLALDAADRAEPAGLARPALALAALCDPAGHPDALWATPAVTTYLSAHRDGPPVTGEQARRALRLLHRYGLLTHTPGDAARAVRVHALTARAMRETTDLDAAVVARAAADALLQLWRDGDHASIPLATALRANTTVLADHAGDLLWHPDAHPLLYRAGRSLLDAGLHTTAGTYWEDMTRQAGRLLGAEHPDTVSARANLAASHRQAGRTADAIALEEKVLADRLRLHGENHPKTVIARANLAASYQQAGRTADAITIGEEARAGCVRLLGENHPDTVSARANLAASYREAGRTAEAIALEEAVLADRLRLLGAEHPHTVSARANLAASYRQAGRTAEAITLEEAVLADRLRLLGAEHPHTVSARANLAASYQQAGRTADAITLAEEVLAERLRLLGESHPDTVGARASLAVSYRQAGRTADAIALEEAVLADRLRLLGESHPDTVGARANLAASYQQAGRTADAIGLLEDVLADRVRLLGAEHPHTLIVRANLATSYQRAGRTAEAIGLLEQVLADCVRLLGVEHPDTVNARGNLAVSYQQAGRVADAIGLLEEVLADSVRLLGENHPDTLLVADALRDWTGNRR
ncbi:tetratricopeptide repeat protein [Micromonospora sp. NPDC050495]|uniref:tetratricopeptide repeat protein n=1 Tax=Micromonospora sp. NPDC050495 TaxID=3154936 RepID=UPI0033F7210F